MIVVRDLAAGYRGNVVVPALTLGVVGGEILGLAGPNGCGKTTVLKAIAGVIEPLSGSITIGSQVLAPGRPWTRARSGIGYLPQREALFPSFTGEETLHLVASIAGQHTDAFRRRVIEMWPSFCDFSNVALATMSGGQQRQLALAINLSIPDRRVLMLDEPAAELSTAAESHFFAQIEAAASAGCAVLMVEQRIESLCRIAHRVCTMRDGLLAMEYRTPKVEVDAILRDVRGESA